MLTFRRIFATHQNLVIIMLACAFVVRALIPQGMMLGAKDGVFEISICSEQGRKTAWLDTSGQMHDTAPEKEQAETMGCAFAAMAGVAQTHQAAPALHFNHTAYTHHTLASVSVGKGLAAPPPPQTGPPLLI